MKVKMLLKWARKSVLTLTRCPHISRYKDIKITTKCGGLHDLVPFAQFKKREKHPWKSVNFSRVAGFKPATLPKLTLLHGFFSRFLNCKNGTKLRNAPQMVIFKRLHIIRVKKYLESFLYKLIWFSVEKAFGVPGTKYF